MLNKKYEIVATTMIHKDVGTYTCYGIRFGADIISDISMDKVKVELLVERMNANELSPLHMMDVVEDFLAEDSNFFSCN